jgi:hypothetical protein
MKRFVFLLSLLLAILAVAAALTGLGLFPKQDILPGSLDIPMDADTSFLAFVFLSILAGWSLYFSLKSNVGPTNDSRAASEPWLGRKEWADNELPCEIGKLYRSILFAAGFTAVTVGFLFLTRTLWTAGQYAPLFILMPFGLVAIGMVILSVRSARDYLRYGRLTLRIDPYPGAIGGQVGGKIDIAMPFSAQNFFHIVVSCVRISHTGRRHLNESAPDIYTLWTARGMAHTQSHPDGTRIEFRFDVPDDLPESSAPSFNHIEWYVDLRLDSAGIKLDRRFKIPVFTTGRPSTHIKRDSVEHADYEKARDREIISIMKMERVGGSGVDLHFAMFHRKKTRGGLILSAVGLGTLLPGAVMIQQGVFAVGIPFFLTGLIFTPAGLYGLFHHLSVYIDATRIVTRLKILGVPFRTQIVPRSEIECLGLKMDQWVGARLVKGGSLTLSQAFGDEATADQALQRIARWSGYPILPKGRKGKQRRQKKPE